MGYDAVALTADFTWFGNRERDTRNGFSVPPNYSVRQIVEAIKRPAWTWDLLVNDVYTYANIDKNVPAESMAAFINKQLCPDFNWKDAEWLSNHGGRQLETAVPTIDVLPSIRAAVGKDVEIVIGGTDIAKALAMGADAVGVGKAYLYGLAAGGKPGGRKAIDTLHVELERAMGLLGTRTVEELKARGPELIKKRQTSEWPPKDYVVPKFEEDKGPGKIAIEEAA